MAGSTTVTGRFCARLRDASFTEVGVNHADATPFKERVEMAFFSQHAFAFDQPLDPMVLHDRQHDPVALGGRQPPQRTTAP
ncbi:MAG UNVERIFIED_CONTAM: hypothetical protein LVR18_45265 [Planctomycetaceae bacterium]|jgi:hypothetical protein